ncbi:MULTISPECIES: pseudoazurin [unclassified Devosia]|uniref:pseudoazurin n=1 Tax=unclassified Devosia TaxID=196773 RepID=UPI00145D146A|nr:MULTISPECIES: pseudoazurin [unclassified Devosia]MBJ6987396.1 pseudoazurin [Devosia sp. MC521]MBJ7578105.1 pseudoazurin [Devosia sp. MC532]MBK1794205.1 pseudoazurin [Devosia sp. WQ 349K1]QMW63565.1 pseudoazurin [Devosia sp. MC521]
MNLLRTIAFAGLATAMTIAAASAANYEVKMLNKGTDGTPMVFEPAFLQIEVGDSVTFIPTDKSHNAESIKDLIPEGATPFKGKLNEEITVTFDVEGAYAYKCLPHLGMGMVGLIVVGDAPANLADITAAKMPKKSADAFAAMAAMVK